MDIQERINAIQQRRGETWHKAQAFLEDLEGVEMNAEQRVEWGRYNEELDSLQADGDSLIERAETETERAQVREAQSIAFGADPDDKNEARQANRDLTAWIRGEKRNEVTNFDGASVNGIVTNLRGVRRERDLVRMGASPEEVRALAWDTWNVASTVPTLFDRTLYQILEEGISAFKMPFRRLSTDSGAPMDMPQANTLGIATQVIAQGTTIGGTDPAFAKVTLTPVKYGQIVTVPVETVTDSGADIVSFVAQDIGRAVGTRINKAVMAEITSSAFVGAAGTASTGGSLIGPTFSNLIDLEFSVNDSYRSSSGRAYLMRDLTAGAVRKLRDGAGGTEGAPLWQPNLTGGLSGFTQPAMLNGHPVYTDANIASQASNAKIMYFGDWSSFYLRTVGELMVERNDSVGFAADNVLFRGKWRADSAAADLKAISLLKASVS